MATTRPFSHVAAPFAPAQPKLGLLVELPGAWVGAGFNLEARPDLKVADRETHGSPHIEPELWINVPVVTEPNVVSPIVLRQATIPHGDSLLAHSAFIDDNIPGGPKISPYKVEIFSPATRF